MPFYQRIVLVSIQSTVKWLLPWLKPLWQIQTLRGKELTTLT